MMFAGSFGEWVKPDTETVNRGFSGSHRATLFIFFRPNWFKSVSISRNRAYTFTYYIRTKSFSFYPITAENLRFILKHVVAMIYHLYFSGSWISGLMSSFWFFTLWTLTHTHTHTYVQWSVVISSAMTDIATGHAVSPGSSLCHPSLLYLNQQLKKCSLGKNGCSIECASQEELWFSMVEHRRRNRPRDGLTSVSYIYVCPVAASLPASLTRRWRVDWHLMWKNILMLSA